MGRNTDQFTVRIEEILRNIINAKEKGDLSELLNEIHRLYHYSEDYILKKEMRLIEEINHLSELKQQYIQIFNQFDSCPDDQKLCEIDNIILFYKKWHKELEQKPF